MKSFTLSPAVGWGIVVVAVAGIIFGYWYFTTPTPEKVDIRQFTREEIEDPDPPKRGQPGYRERTTDPPNPG